MKDSEGSSSSLQDCSRCPQHTKVCDFWGQNIPNRIQICKPLIQSCLWSRARAAPPGDAGQSASNDPRNFSRPKWTNSVGVRRDPDLSLPGDVGHVLPELGPVGKRGHEDRSGVAIGEQLLQLALTIGAHRPM